MLPEEANPVKVAAMRALGAELIFHGRNFDEAKDHCERLAAEEGYRYAHPANEPLLIAGGWALASLNLVRHGSNSVGGWSTTSLGYRSGGVNRGGYHALSWLKEGLRITHPASRMSHSLRHKSYSEPEST